MKRIFLSACLLVIAAAAVRAQGTRWKLVWADEFNYTGLPDSAKWNWETEGNAYGWGNNEKEFYTHRDKANSYVSNGVLTIAARKEAKGGRSYTSARLSTAGKFGFKYGKIEARIKMPAGRGTWPAFWLLGENIKTTKWPDCGEIDIMEHVGYEPDTVRGTIHTAAYNHIKGTQKTKGIFLPHVYDRYHTYAVEWTKEGIGFYVDGKLYHHFANEHRSVAEWPFDQQCYIILNLAIGGDWGGKKGIDDSAFPTKMEVDYVRVYQQR